MLCPPVDHVNSTLRWSIVNINLSQLQDKVMGIKLDSTSINVLLEIARRMSSSISFQLMTIIHVVAMVSMKTTILAFIAKDRML